MLSCKMCQDKEIQGIRIFNSEAKISQFADDTSLICKSCHSVEKAIDALDSFGNLSWLCGLALGMIENRNHLG